MTNIFHSLVVVAMVTVIVTSALDLSSGFNFGDLFGNLGGGSATCPSECICEKASLSDYFSNFFRVNSETIGIHYRSMENNVISKILQIMESNIFLRLLGGGIITNMTCQIGAENSSVESVVSQAPGFLVQATFICEDNVTINFNDYPAGKMLMSLKIFGCNVSSSSERFTIPLFNTLQILELNNIRGDWLHKLSLGNLGQLRALQVTNCNLKKLPVIWTNISLANLFLLDLRQNGLEEFNCEIGWGTNYLFAVQPSIDTINLENNELVEIPRCILEKTLRVPYISLARNRFTNTRVFRQVNSYISTYYLNLEYNQIEELEFLTYSNITLLDLSHNRISRLTVNSFRKADKYNILKTLDLSNNRINSIEYGSLDFTPLLEYLDLSHNLLKAFDFDHSPAYIENVTIDLRYNRLKYPPFQSTSYFGPRSVKALAAGNPFTCDCALLEFAPIYTQLMAFNLSETEQRQTLFSPTRPFSDAVEYRCQTPYYLSGERVIDTPKTEKCPVVENCPPVCQCSRVNHRVTVNCENRHLETLPRHFPDAQSLSINLRNNSIAIVDYRPYFNRTSDLDLSHNEIRNVTASGIFALIRIPTVQLHSNKLIRLPDSTKHLRLDRISSMSLDDNPWQCSCETFWMKSWLLSIRGHLLRDSNVKCANDPFTGIPILDVAKEDMDCDKPSYIITAVVLGILSTILLLVAILVFYFRLEIKVLLYVRFHWTILKTDIKVADLPYDVFVSFSQHDYKWIVHTLTPYLENRAAPYKLCIHYRDFPVGEPIAESITRAVENSRCTLMYLTNEFLRSEWCMYEFKTAHQRLFEAGNSKVVMILEDGLDTRGLDKTLSAYLKTHTYIRVKDKLFWDKLIYALPTISKHPVS